MSRYVTAYIGEDGEAVVIERERGPSQVSLPTRFVLEGVEMGADKFKGIARKRCHLSKGAGLDDAIRAMWQHGYDFIDRRFSPHSPPDV